MCLDMISVPSTAILRDGTYVVFERKASLLLVHETDVCSRPDRLLRIQNTHLLIFLDSVHRIDSGRIIYILKSEQAVPPRSDHTDHLSSHTSNNVLSSCTVH